MKAIKLGMAAAAIAVGATLPAQAGSHGDKVLTVAIETDVRGFDAVKANVLGIAASTVFNTLTERMGEWDGDGNLTPHLAESWEVAPDGMAVTFQLRKGVKFSDGSDFTARDVAEHWNRLMDPKNRYFGRLFFGPIKGAVADGDHTVTIQLKHPWVPAINMHGAYSFGAYVPQAANVAADKQMREPIGTGPYQLADWRSGDRIIVDRNPHYWNKDRVKLDRIVFRIIPDQATRYAALQSGEVDVIWTDRGDTIQKAEKNDKLNMYSRVGSGAGIGFMNAAKAPFDNANARKAFLHTWNQAAYVKVSIKDTVPVVTNPLGPDIQCADNHRDHDIKKAKEFAAAYEADTGNKISFEAIHTSTQRGREFGQIMQQLGKRAGLDIKLQPVDQLQLRQKVFTNNYNVSGWRIADTGDVGPQLFALLHSKSPYNLGKYNNPKMDQLVVAMRVAPTMEKRIAATCEVVKQMNDDGTIFFTNGRKHYAITNKSVSAIPPLFQGVPDVRFLTKN
jgi:ABC-type transport system substrate-binding protein